MSEMPCVLSWSPLNALIAIPTELIDWLRFCAVTMMSPTPALSCPAAGSVGCCDGGGDADD